MFETNNSFSLGHISRLVDNFLIQDRGTRKALSSRWLSSPCSGPHEPGRILR